MRTIITVQCKSGPRSVSTVWQGATLAIHHPITANGTPSREPCWWAVTHKPTGLMVCPAIDAPLYIVKVLATAWDPQFAALDPVKGAAGWPLASRWLNDVNRANRGRPIIGPRDLTPLEALESAGTAAEVTAAVRLAMGHHSTPEPQATEQFPVSVTRKTTGRGAVRKNPDGVLEYCWLPTGGNYSDADAITLAGWYVVPSMADVEDWCLDSAAETPSGDVVESDHPDSWPVLLGVL